VFLVVAVVGAATGTVATVLERSTRDTLRADLANAERVFAESWSYRRSVLRSEARVIAEEPRVKAVTAAEDVGRETIVSVALELHQAVQTDLFVLADARGKLILDAQDPEQSGQDLMAHQVIREALAKGDASGVWIAGQTPFQVQARRLEFGETPFGVLVVGYALGQKFADSLERQLGTRALLELDGVPVVVSDSAGKKDLGGAPLAAALSRLPSRAVQEIDVSGQHYLAIAGGLPGYTGERKLRYGLLRSLDVALAPSLRLRRLLLVIAAVALLVAMACATLLSGMLSRPLEALVGLTREFAAGRLHARAALAGPREIRLLAGSLNTMAADLERSQRALRERERLERELEIAERIQTALLPKAPEVEGLEIAARMVPAATVGGDYYDVLPVDGGAWIGVGDVAGHGLTAGLIMLMVQSGTASLVRALPAAPPSRVVKLLNDVVFANVQERLRESEHVTYSLLRYHEDGLVVHAGAHEDMIVYRKRDHRCEIIGTRGMWLGAMSNIDAATVDGEIRLEPGDMLVLYSDGIIESRNDAQEMYGIERLVAMTLAFADKPATDLSDAIFTEVGAHAKEQIDDRTLVVLRRTA
jgi:sigma-B regulation protein RsbU (phosphoserine phosphatase)